MVQQYLYRPMDRHGEPTDNIYQHDFMSAGEEAFRYLVERGLDELPSFGEAPVAVALLIATAAGILLTATAGTLRILQLRRRTRKDLKRR